jgi:integrase
VRHIKKEVCDMATLNAKLTGSLLKSVDPSIRRISDTEVRGFHVRLGKPKADGSRQGAYYLYYRIGGRNGLERNFKIGELSENGLTPSKARDEAEVQKGLIKKGIDVFAEREAREQESIAKKAEEKAAEVAQVKKESETVEYLVNEFIERYVKRERKRPESAINIFNNDVLPQIGKVPLSDITSRLILNDCIDLIVDRGHKPHARKTLALIKQAFQFGVDRGLIQANPIANTSVTANTGKEISRDRFLTDDELKQLFKDLPNVGITRQVQLVIELLCLTGCRVQEMCLAEWSHVDFEERMWFFPPENTKSRRGEEKPHFVPMNGEIIKRLKELSAQHNYLASKFVFPSVTNRTGQPGDQPLDKRSIARAIKRHIKPEEGANPNGRYINLEAFTPHDFRRTLQTHLSKMKVDTIVTEKLLNHELAGMLRVYNQHDYMDERREALELWANKIKEITK